MRLQLVPWPEVETYLQRSSGIIIPIGSTEQHGPSGAIGTDAICAEAIALGVGDAADAMVAPTLAIGMALHHLAFPGSMSLQPSTLIAVVRDVVASLARHGFDRFFFINGHGGNIATLKAAFPETYAELGDRLGSDRSSRIRCRICNWFMGRAVHQLARDLYGDREGSHATPSEVALTQYVYPESIRQVPLDPNPPSGHAIYSAEDFRKHYPDGRMGSDPSLATPEAGQQFYERAVKEITEEYLKFLKSD